MTTSVPPDNDGNNGPINVSRVSVDRMSVDKSEIKTAEVDLLIAISQATMDQTTTIEDSNKEIAKHLKELVKNRKSGSDDPIIEALKDGFAELIPAINRSRVASEDQADAGGLVASEMRRTQAEFQVINKEGKTLGQILIDLKDIREILQRNLMEPVRLFNSSVTKVISSMSNLNNVLEHAQKQYRNSLDLAAAGMVSDWDIYMNQFEKIFSPIEKAGDDIVATGKMIQSSIQADLVSPLIMVHGNINDVSKTFNKFRKQVKDAGTNLHAYMGFEGQNEVFAEFVSNMRRQGIKDDINDESMVSRFTSQVDFLKVIAANTGLTVKELSEKTAKDGKTLNEIGATLLKGNEEAMITLTGLSKALEATGNVRANEMVLAFTEAQGNFALLPEKFRNILIAGGMTDLPQQIYDKVVAGADTKETVAFTEGKMRSLTAEINKSYLATGFGTKVLEGIGSGVADYAKELVTQTNTAVLGDETPKEGTVNELINRFKDYFMNVLPGDALKSLGSIAGNTIALGLNTLAIYRLSTVLGAAGIFGSMKSVVGRIFGKGKGLGAKAGMAAALGTSGLAATSMKKAPKAAAPSLAKAGLGAAGKVGARAIPLLGTLLAGGASVGSFMEGDMLGGFGHAGAAIASLIPGLGTGAALAIEGALAARDIFGEDSAAAANVAAPGAPAIASPSAASPGAGRGGALEQLVTNSNREVILLAQVIGQMKEGNEIQRGIRDRIGLSPLKNTAGATGRESSVSTSGVALVASPIASR